MVADGQTGQLDAPTGELPRVELASGISGLGVVRDAGGGTTAEDPPIGELPKVLDTGTEVSGIGAGDEGTTAGVVVVGTGAGTADELGMTGTTLVVTYGEVVAGQLVTVGWQLVMVTT